MTDLPMILTGLCVLLSGIAVAGTCQMMVSQDGHNVGNVSGYTSGCLLVLGAAEMLLRGVA